MSGEHFSRQASSPGLWRWLLSLEALSFFTGALLHAGLAVGPFDEPTIGPAAVVESLCGTVLAVAAAAAIAEARSWRSTAIAAQAIALAGVLLGVAALAAGRGPRTTSNDVYHYTMIVLLVSGIAILASAERRVRGHRQPAAGPAR